MSLGDPAPDNPMPVSAPVVATGTAPAAVSSPALASAALAAASFEQAAATVTPAGAAGPVPPKPSYAPPGVKPAAARVAASIRLAPMAPTVAVLDAVSGPGTPGGDWGDPGRSRRGRSRVVAIAAAVLILGSATAGGVWLLSSHDNNDDTVASETASGTGSDTAFEEEPKDTNAGVDLSTDPSSITDPGSSTDGSTKSSVSEFMPGDDSDIDEVGHPVSAPSPDHAWVTFTRADSDCSYPSSVDSAGSKTDYKPEYALDHMWETAWRCPGAGGHTIGMDTDFDWAIYQLGLVPGYAKVDPASGADRFTDNYATTQVVWRLWDGTSWHRVVQDIAEPSQEYAWVELDDPIFATRVEMTVTKTTVGTPRVDSTPISDVAAIGDPWQDYD